MSIGVANKNPMNVKSVPGGWFGQIDKDAHGHAIFACWDYGYRAGILNLRSYWRKGKRTIREIVREWTAVEADWEEYEKFLSDYLQASPTEAIHFFMKERVPQDNIPIEDVQLEDLVLALSRFECGPEFKFDEAAYERGLKLARYSL